LAVREGRAVARFLSRDARDEAAFAGGRVRGASNIGDPTITRLTTFKGLANPCGELERHVSAKPGDQRGR
jgi:hypothetical protein